MKKYLRKKLIPMTFISLMLIAASTSTSYTQPDRCKYGQGLLIYNNAYEQQKEYLEGVWQEYSCSEIDKFNNYAQYDYPTDGWTLNRVCRYAGKSDAGWDISFEKIDMCNSENDIEDGPQDCFEECHEEKVGCNTETVCKTVCN